MSLAPGTRLGPYEILTPVGRGGMGDVYAARDSRLQRTVAIKICREEFSERFEREARAVAALNHHNICTLHDVGPNYIVMEMVEGPTLAEVIVQRVLPPLEAARIAQQIAKALAAAHHNGVVHRDLKPANIKITPDGVVKVLDFGLAKTADSDAAIDGPTVTARGATGVGVVMGTVAYMSPEQAEGLPVDHRTDIWSLGIVLYQMLARRTPFDAGTTQRTIIDILRKPAPALTGVPRQLARIVDKCLEKNREARYHSADALIADLEAWTAALNTERASALAALRRPRLLIPAVAALLVLTSVLAWSWQRSRWQQWARQEAVPQAHRLADAGDYIRASQLAAQAEAYIPGDRALQQLWSEVSHALAVQSEPGGAEVEWKPYAEPDSPWQPLGLTPVNAHRLPGVPIRLRLTKSGYAPVEIAATGRQYEFTLARQTDLPSEMVRVPAGSLRAQYAGIGELTAALGSFDIDRTEVTNRQFKAFIDKGGYRNRSWWTEPFIENGRTLTWEGAMARFVDPAGRPGPSTWEAGSYPEGHGDDPVTGVSWYEAAAYPASVGKTLPTVYHWFRAANTDDSHFLVPFSNFASPRALPAARSNAIGSFGAVDMAGNVREWCWNAGSVGRRYILGGSYADQSYMLTRGQVAPAFDRSSANGFRCVKGSRGAGAAALTAPVIPAPPPAYLSARPVSDDVFGLYESLYAYERSDLKAVVESVDESSELWRREKITFDAGYGGERMIAYLFLPRNPAPQVPCIVVMPSGSTIVKRPGESIRPDPYILRSGRAMLYPVFKGTLDHFVKPISLDPIWIRDSVVAWRKDLSRSVDYLATRKDIDSRKLGYLGQSMGSEVAPILLSMERRFAAAVLLSGGLTPLLGKLPEVNAVTFLPRVKTPVLMVNGKYDTILAVDTQQEPMFEQLGTPPADKRRIVLDAGHSVSTPETQNALIKAVLEWFDKYL